MGVKLLRLVTAVLSLGLLAACTGQEGADKADAPAPRASASAPASPAGVASAPAAPADGGDVSLCETADVAKKAFAQSLAPGVDSQGHFDPGTLKAALVTFAGSLRRTAASGADGEVTRAMRELAAYLSKAAEEKDPESVLDSTELTRIGESFDAKCAKAGFTPTTR